MSWHVNPSRLNTSNKNAMSLHDSIAIIQRSFTRAMNHRKNWSGSLFRANYKSEEAFSDELINLQDEYSIGKLLVKNSIVNLIHHLPINENLCERKTDWKYSSAREYVGLCKVTFCDVTFKIKTKSLKGR
jgi:putative transposase